MTATPARPHDFGAWVLTVSPRRLGDLARPAAGRVRRHVLFASIPVPLIHHGARQLETLLGHATGPTRCGPIVVQAFFTADQVDLAFTDPLLADVPVDQLTRARAMWEAMPGWVLLIGYCRVLWRQAAHRVECS
jgi:hypothetical protein